MTPYQLEADLEARMLEQLSKQGWEIAKISDHQEMEGNFRLQFSIFNEQNLLGRPLSDGEFHRLMINIKDRGVFASAKLLREKQILIRDDDSQMVYSLLDTKKWCQNIFQVSSQVVSIGNKFKTRGDITFFINGLPIVQCELKRSGVGMKEAFYQVSRYKADNAYNGLFNFLQFFVISNGINTRYFANSNSSELNKAFMFRWTDSNNNEYNSLAEITQNFFETCWISKMVSEYMILKNKNKEILIMRPYQVYGVESITKRALETKNNGFIWHTTGSGKTLTSFKVAQILANYNKFNKIVFLVDRKDLNRQTFEEFEKFQKGSVVNSENTKHLVENLRSTHRDKKLIITTIQKLDKIIKNSKYQDIITDIKNHKIAFIIDECHRTQYGSMHMAMRNHFTNAQYFGFTGTPRFPENKSIEGQTTADMFEKCMHTYLLKDAIRDHNTLPFSIKYMDTIKAKDEITDADKVVNNILEKEITQHPKRINQIVNNIFEDRKRKSYEGQYNAMFTVDSIGSACLYKDAFTRLNESLSDKERLVVATVYSDAPNGELNPDQEHPRMALDRYITEYNEIFDRKYSTERIDEYIGDVADKFRAGRIDILIVVDMMLTGFDSKILNTLYVDRNFEHHSLVQAYSRTNRVCDSNKREGHIVCYRNLKEKTDFALKLFSEIDDVDIVMAPTFYEQEKLYQDAIERLFLITATPSGVRGLSTENEKKEFILAFRDFNGIFRRISTFVEFKSKNYDISSQEIQDFTSHYLDLKEELDSSSGLAPESVLQDIDFRLDEINTDLVNVDYLISLLAQLNPHDPVDLKDFRNKILRTRTGNASTKYDILMDFLDNYVRDLSVGDNPLEQYENFEEKRIKEIIDANSIQFGLTPDTLKGILLDFKYSNKVKRGFNTHTTLPLRGRSIARDKLVNFVESVAPVFETVTKELIIS